MMQKSVGMAHDAAPSVLHAFMIRAKLPNVLPQDEDSCDFLNDVCGSLSDLFGFDVLWET